MIAVWFGLWGCTSEEPPATSVLPTETGESDVPFVDTGYYRPPDTAIAELGDEIPANVILLEQTGTWSLSPGGGPYNALVGSFRSRELLDGIVPDTSDTGARPECDATFALQGSPAPEPNGCPDCSHVWDVQFTLRADSETGVEPCHDPDLPGDGDTWRLGYAPGTGTVWFNFYGTGVWIPWWGAVQSGDTVIIAWTRELAIHIPAEDP